MTPREGQGRLRVTPELLTLLLDAANYRVERALPPDAVDLRNGSISLEVHSRALPVLAAGAVLPEVVCDMTLQVRQSNISPILTKETSP